MNGAPGQNYRKSLIKLITFIGGLYFFLEFILPARVLEGMGIAPYHEQISYGFITVGAMAFGLGLINLIVIHGSRLVFRKQGWVNSLALLCGLAVMIFLSTADWFAGLSEKSLSNRMTIVSRFAAQIKKDETDKKGGVPSVDFRILKLNESASQAVEEAETRADSVPVEASKAVQASREELRKALSECKAVVPVNADAGDLAVLNTVSERFASLSVSFSKMETALHEESLRSRLFTLLKNGLFVSLGSAMFALLGFYIAAAAYRAFRVRSFESGLMMAAALVVMLGQMSFALRYYEGFAAWRGWLMDVPNSAAFRAIRIGAGVAGLVLAFRMWFSIESESFSRKQ